MKKFGMSKIWIALAVVVFGGVCFFLPSGSENLTANMSEAVTETVQDSIATENIDEE